MIPVSAIPKLTLPLALSITTIAIAIIRIKITRALLGRPVAQSSDYKQPMPFAKVIGVKVLLHRLSAGKDLQDDYASALPIMGIASQIASYDDRDKSTNL